MKAVLKSLALAAVAVAASVLAAAAAPVEVVVQYSQPQIFDKVFEQMKTDFESKNPDIKIKFRGPHKDYGAGLGQAAARNTFLIDPAGNITNFYEVKDIQNHSGELLKAIH